MAFLLNKIIFLIAACVLCNGKDLTPGYQNFCADPGDYKPYPLGNECTGAVTTKDACEKAGCTFDTSKKECKCGTKVACSAAGGEWWEKTCNSLFQRATHGYSSCGCEIIGKMNLKTILDSPGNFCCGGKPHICADFSGSAVKNCEQKFFCKANQYASDVSVKRVYPGHITAKVAGKCLDCPTGATCDGSPAVNCGTNKYFSTKAKNCLACPAQASCDGKAIVDCGDKGKYIKDGQCVDCPAGGQCDGQRQVTLTVGYSNFCADENDFQADTIIARECRGPPQNKEVPQDKCEKAGCKYLSDGNCVCKDPSTCGKVGGTWFVDTCGKTYRYWTQGYDSCDCIIHPHFTVKGMAEYMRAKCCGGKPTMCKDAGQGKKKCDRKYFCKAHQYTEETRKQETWPGAMMDVAGKCTDCPPGMTCDGSQTVGCADKTKRFDTKSKQCVPCANGVCPTTKSVPIVQTTGSPSLSDEVTAGSPACLNALKMTVMLAGIVGLM